MFVDLLLGRNGTVHVGNLIQYLASSESSINSSCVIFVPLAACSEISYLTKLCKGKRQVCPLTAWHMGSLLQVCGVNAYRSQQPAR
jgi:hypothetical protein